MTYQEKGPVAKTDSLSFNPIIRMLEKEDSCLQVVLLTPCVHTPHTPSYIQTHNSVINRSGPLCIKRIRFFWNEI